jgi:hypothetical protein
MLILICPWCGENLKYFYKESMKELNGIDLKID